MTYSPETANLLNFVISTSTTAEVMNEFERIKFELAEAEKTIAGLERRVAELGGLPVEYIGRKTNPINAYPYHVVDVLYLRKHPSSRQGMVTMYTGDGAPSQPTGSQYTGSESNFSPNNHDLILWNPACSEPEWTQAAAADYCLRLAVTHGLNVGVLSQSEHFFDRLRLREAECPDYGKYITVKYFTIDSAGVSEYNINISEEGEEAWPKRLQSLGVCTEVSIGWYREEGKMEEGKEE